MAAGLRVGNGGPRALCSGLTLLLQPYSILQLRENILAAILPEKCRVSFLVSMCPVIHVVMYWMTKV